MKTLYQSVLLLAICCCLGACVTQQPTTPYKAPPTQINYSLSVGDAAKPQPWEISQNLVAIAPSNAQLVWKKIDGEDYVLVSSWKEDTTYYKNDPKTGFYNTSKYPIWVTAAPELQRACQAKNFGKKEGLDMRLKQLLGLPPNDKKKFFVEFWVRPQDLFRPCPDSEVDDFSCGLAFPENATDEHKAWVNNLRLESYYNSAWYSNYPWTQLGYTYDWNPKNKSHIGLSEFVIGKNKNIKVKGFYATKDYCRSSN